jgi:hypothetical protein
MGHRPVGARVPNSAHDSAENSIEHERTEFAQRVLIRQRYRLNVVSPRCTAGRLATLRPLGVDHV